jgi:nicotinamide mononucleotide transporter
MEYIINYLQSNIWEHLGIATTLICVWLNIKQNIWAWPLAIIASAIYGYIFYQESLYSDMELQFVFIIISIYGWWQWLNGNTQKDNLPVTNTPQKELLILLVFLVSFACISGYLHGKYSNASFPYFDSALTAISLVAQWMLAKKYLQNWILWIVANLGYIGMYYSKNLYGTSVLYFLLLIMAAKGFWDWKKSILSGKSI